MKKSLLFLVSFVVFVAPISSAANKNGVSPNTISLPSGPGSIEGLGDSFQPMLNTGSARYSVKIALPSGVTGNTPELTLQYDSGTGDGPVGIGWNFGPGSIRRQTDKGIPRYIDSNNGIDDDFDTIVDNPEEIDQILGPDGEELVPMADGSYRARIERSFVRYRKVGDYWEADLKNGTKLVFGKSISNRVTDETGTKIYKWLLETQTDVNGNVIEYIYTSFPDSDNQKYLKEIRYGPGVSPWNVFYFVSLTYENRPDWRKDYRAGFLIKSAKRLKQIDIGIQGTTPQQCVIGDFNQDSVADALIRRYALEYGNGSSEGYFLKKVTQYGADGVNYLPPISFDYNVFTPELNTLVGDALKNTLNPPSSVMDRSRVELIDLNKDGLPDILETQQFGGVHRVYANLGERPDSGTIEWTAGVDVVTDDPGVNNLYLGNDQVHLSDMDGDGLADLVQKTVLDEVLYYPNKGNLSWGVKQRMFDQNDLPPAPFAEQNVRSSDFDFNKRMDIIRSSEFGYSIWMNLGDTKYSKKITSPGAIYQDSVLNFDQNGVKLADINGDRLNDVIYLRSANVIYAANMGHGRFAEAVSIPLPDFNYAVASLENFKHTQFRDIDGDGLSDLVIEITSGNQLWYWLNRGSDNFSEKHTISGLPSGFSMDSTTRWADINGNGTTDLIFADSNLTTERLRYIDIGELTGGSDHPNLLRKIDNGLGVVTTIHYQSSTEQFLKAREEGKAWQSTLPFPTTVISKVETTTGLDLDLVAGKDRYVKTFDYANGYYDDLEKAFRGFSLAEVIEPGDTSMPGQLTRNHFYTGGPDGIDNDRDGAIDEILGERFREEEALKGMPIKVEVLSTSETLFSTEENRWFIKTLDTAVTGEELRLALKEETQKKIYEGSGTPQTLITVFTYDNFGNLTEENNLGAVSQFGDEVVTSNEYINDTQRWLIGLLYHQTITSGTGTKVAESFSYYDGAAYQGLALGTAEKGKLTRLQGWVEDGKLVDLARNQYDSYGNITGIKDPNSNLRTIDYDQELHIYPEKETIHMGPFRDNLVVFVAYNKGLGKITTSTDFNGNQTEYTYDTFARPVSVVKPDDSPQFPTQEYQYEMSDPENGIIYQYDKAGTLTLINATGYPSSIITKTRENFLQAGTFDTIQYVDGMGRKLAAVEEGETGFIFKESVLFNGRGKPQYQFLSYENESNAYTPPSILYAKIETSYDATGREVLKINPPAPVEIGGGAVNTYFTTQYSPLSIRTTDENDQVKTIFNDGLGRVIEVHEENRGETYRTKYEYDTLGNLTKITDAQNNIKRLTYDGLKRKTWMNDPDAGIKAYQYDDAGNLLQTTDAKDQVITYTYDAVNRVLTEDWLDNFGFTPDISYHYDSPGNDYPEVENLKGQLSWVKDHSGARFFSYDNRGNAVKEITRVTVNGQSTDYEASLVIDSMGKPVSKTFPDGESIQYEYNNRTLLHAIPGFVDSIAYKPTGQYESFTYANSISTAYTYDARQRLENMVTTEQAGEPLQDLSYAFDGVSNITKITDNRPLDAGAKQNVNQGFLYDDLNRLTQAKGQAYGTINYAYDKIGNMIHKQSPTDGDAQHVDDPLINLGTMNYGGVFGTNNRSGRSSNDPAGPHAITATQGGTGTGGFSYTYDDNGNMTSHATGDIYSWNFRNRLVQVQRTVDSQSVESRYVYNADGRRAIRQITRGADEKFTVYVSKDYEIREGKTYKYIFAGDRRVARVESGTQAPTTPSNQQTLSFKTGWNFFSLTLQPDNAGIDTLFAALTGKFTEIATYDTESQSYQFYDPDTRQDFTSLQPGKGYLIYVTEDCSVEITGTPVQLGQSLASGWNLVAANVNTSLPIEETLATAKNQIKTTWYYNTENSEWQRYSPNQSEPSYLNDLYTGDPGKSYWINADSNTQLDFVDPTKEKTTFYHPDHLGSTSLTTNESGAVLSETAYYPFGRPRYQQTVDGKGSFYKYTGKEMDQTGLFYYEARYMDPVIGRFISADPLIINIGDAKNNIKNQYQRIFDRTILNPQEFNLFSYTGNNPIKYVDPTGLTFYGRYMGESKPGESNPFRVRGINALDDAARLHDIDFSRIEASGAKGLFWDRGAIAADYRLAARAFASVFSANWGEYEQDMGVFDRAWAAVVAIGAGSVGTGKLIVAIVKGALLGGSIDEAKNLERNTEEKEDSHFF